MTSQKRSHISPQHIYGFRDHIK